jgi:hypothetical protein
MVLGAMIAAGLVLALPLTFVAGATLCGKSGCTGPEFQLVTDPATTLALLVAAGIGAAAPLGCYAAWARNWRLALTAVTLAVLTTLAAGLWIGADVHGCPRNFGAQTCPDSPTSL